MTPSDWLPAFDDMLVERPTNCTQCGQPAARLDLRIINGRAWAVSLCKSCLTRDPDLHELDARLAAMAREAQAC